MTITVGTRGMDGDLRGSAWCVGVVERHRPSLSTGELVWPGGTGIRSAGREEEMEGKHWGRVDSMGRGSRTEEGGERGEIGGKDEDVLIRGQSE